MGLRVRPHSIMSGTLFLAALLSSGSDQCKKIHYTADGRILVTMVDGNESVAKASSNSSGSYSSSSSVSASSSSNGTSSATSSSSADGKRRTVSVKRDASGCTVTVDERPSQE